MWKGRHRATHSPGKGGERNVAEAAGRVVDGPPVAAGQGREVGGQRGDCLVVVGGVVGELDGDGLRGAVGDRAVQLLDGALRLDALVEPDEAHALRQAWGRGAGGQSHSKPLNTRGFRTRGSRRLNSNALQGSLMEPHTETYAYYNQLFYASHK